MKRLVIVVVSALMACAVVAYANKPDEKDEQKSSKRGWLGVSIQDITPELKHSMNLKAEEGALVSDVSSHSPADSAGIEEGDVIIQFDGKTIDDTHDLQKTVGKTKPGTHVSVIVLRNGERKTLKLTVGKYPRRVSGHIIQAPHAGVFRMLGMGTYGLRLMELNEQLAEYFGAPEGTGVLVEKVEQESSAEKAGLKAGDVILHIGKKTVDEVSDVSRALGAYEEGEKVDIEVLRKGSRKTLTMEVEEEEDSNGFRSWYGPSRPRIHKFQFNAMPEIDVDEFPFDVDFPEFDFDAGRFELERFRPELDVLRHQLNSMKGYLRRVPIEIHKHMKPLMKPRIDVVPDEI